MFVTVIAVLCYLNTNNCTEKVITDSSLDSSLTFQGCVIGGQAGLAKWKGEHPIYRSEAWHIQRYKCVAGRYEAKARI